MKKSVTLILSVTILSTLWAAPAIDRQAEKRREAQARVNRDRGFQDIEVDNLHGAIQRRVRILSALVGVDEESMKKAQYYADAGTAIDINMEFKRFTDENFLGEVEPGKLKEDRDRFIRKISEIEGNISKSGKVFSMPLGLGISFPGHNQKYLYKTHVHLFTDNDGKQLTGIIFQFDRVNAVGLEYIAERRLLINPNPEDKVFTPETDAYIGGPDFEFAFDEKKEEVNTDQFDPNGDILVEYYEAKADTNGFGKALFIERLVWPDYKTNRLHATMPYGKQLKLLEGYKKYLRKTRDALTIAIRDFDLKRRDRIGKMLDFLNTSR